MPALREHASDIPSYARDLLLQLARESGGRPKELSEGALELLQEHPWPGNVRELQNVVTRAVSSTDADVLHCQDLRAALLEGELSPPSTPAPAKDEETRIRRALKDSGGNVSRAARALGIGRTRMYQLQRQHGIVRE